MACISKIQFKRGSSSNVSSAVLQGGEPAFTMDTEKLYIGTDSTGGTSKVLINPLSETQAQNIITTINDLGSAAYVNVGSTYGDVVTLGADGKLPSSVLPAIAITNTFVVSSQSEMLDLDVQIGDVAIRTDQSKSYIVKSGDGSSISNWEWLQAPTGGGGGGITSVNGDTGPNVVIQAGNSQLTLNGYHVQSGSGVTSPVSSDTVLKAIEKLDNSIKYVNNQFTVGKYVKEVNGKFGPTVTLISSDIKMGSSYVLPSACSPIQSTDTIAQAVAKLEKHLQVIDGGSF